VPRLKYAAGVTDVELLRAMVDLAELAGLSVRSVGKRGSGELEPESGVARLRDDIIVMLAGRDPVETQIGVVASALRDHASSYMDEHFVPPLIRARVSGES